MIYLAKGIFDVSPRYFFRLNFLLYWAEVNHLLLAQPVGLSKAQTAKRKAGADFYFSLQNRFNFN